MCLWLYICVGGGLCTHLKERCIYPQLSLPSRFPVSLLSIHNIRLFYMKHHYIFAGEVEGSFLDPGLEKLREKPLAIKRSNPEPIGFAI